MQTITRFFACLLLIGTGLAHGQSFGTVQMIRYEGQTVQPGATVLVSFRLYENELDVLPLWEETQSLQVQSGRFIALIGATQDGGIPTELFLAHKANWLGVSVNGAPELDREKFAAVPYALKSMEADRLSGYDLAGFLTRTEFEAALQKLSSTVSPSPFRSAEPKASLARPPRTVRSDPPFATAFRVNADGYIYSERDLADAPTFEGVALATGNNMAAGLLGRSGAEQGRGVHGRATAATGNGAAGVLGTAIGTQAVGVLGEATANAGANAGVLGTTNSAAGYGAIFDNRGGGRIAGFQSNGAEIAFVDSAGFHGSGLNLTAIPASALVGSIPGSSVVGDITGNAAGITGLLPVSMGGTGLSTTGAHGNYLRSTGTAWISSPIQAADIVGGSGFVDTSSNQIITGVKEFRNDEIEIIRFSNSVGTQGWVDGDGFGGKGGGLYGIRGSNIVGTIDGHFVNIVNIHGSQIQGWIDSSLLSGPVNPALLGAGIAEIDITGNAVTASTANNALALGGVAAANYVQAGALAGETSARIAADNSLQTNVTAVDTSLSALDGVAAKTNQANVFAVNTKQTFQAGPDSAGLNIRAVNANPSELTDGDVWLRSDVMNLHVRANGMTKTIAFTDTPFNGNAATATALAADGSDCPAGQYALGVDAMGSAEGCTFAGTVTSVTAGAGLVGGNITTSGTIGIADGGITNSMLANNSITVTPGNGMSGGGTTALGGSVTLHNAGVTSIIGTANEIAVSGSNGPVTVSLSASGVTLPGRTKFSASAGATGSFNLPLSSTPLSPVSGDVWNEGGKIRFQDAASTNVLTMASPSSSFVINLGSLGLTINGQSCVAIGDYTGTAPGAAVGDFVMLAPPGDWSVTSLGVLLLNAWVDSPNTVKLRVCNHSASQANLPPNVTVSGRILKF